MSKILFNNSSPNRNGNTARLAAALLEGKDYGTLNLTDYKIYGYAHLLYRKAQEHQRQRFLGRGAGVPG